jgi:hypothetical protein
MKTVFKGSVFASTAVGGCWYADGARPSIDFADTCGRHNRAGEDCAKTAISFADQVLWSDRPDDGRA